MDAEVENWRQGLRERAFRLLARREHSRHELASKLYHPPNSPSRHRIQAAPEQLSPSQIQDEIQQLLDKLEANDLLSDQRFAETLSRQYLRKGKGPLALQQAFQEHQLDASITQPLLKSLGPLWQQQADRVKQKRFGETLPSDAKSRAKMQRFLASRGFTGAQIRQAIHGDD